MVCADVLYHRSVEYKLRKSRLCLIMVFLIKGSLNKYTMMKALQGGLKFTSECDFDKYFA